MSFNWVNKGRFEKKVRLVMTEKDKSYIKEKLYISHEPGETAKESYFFTLNDFLTLFYKSGLNIGE